MNPIMGPPKSANLKLRDSWDLLVTDQKVLDEKCMLYWLRDVAMMPGGI